MYVYIEDTDNELYLVGFYKPDNTFYTESEFDLDKKNDAALRTSFLNGGSCPPEMVM
jgi:hypothetical protein